VGRYSEEGSLTEVSRNRSENAAQDGWSSSEGPECRPQEEETELSRTRRMDRVARVALKP
jgi:hypothetical protein